MNDHGPLKQTGLLHTWERWIKSIRIGTFVLASVAVFFLAAGLSGLTPNLGQLLPCVVAVLVIAAVLLVLSFVPEVIKGAVIPQKAKTLSATCILALGVVMIAAAVLWAVLFLFTDIRKVPDPPEDKPESLAEVGPSTRRLNPSTPKTERPPVKKATVSDDPPPPPPPRHNRITVPEDGGSASYYTGSGQGGRVKVEGESEELGPNQVILLVVDAPDRIAYPQTIGSDLITPDASGHWQGEVQVGDLEFEPGKEQEFTVKMYVVTKDEYRSVKDDNVATGGKARWPSPRLSPRPSELAKTTFVLNGRKD